MPAPMMKRTASDTEDGEIGIKAQQGHRPVRGVHAQHDEGPVGKVDHLHHRRK